MPRYIVVSTPLVSDDCIPSVGPVADTPEQAAEGWYTHVCNVQVWPISDGPCCGAHEELIDATWALKNSMPFTRILWDAMEEAVALVEVPA